MISFRIVNQSIDIDWIGFTDQPVSDKRWKISYEKPPETFENDRLLAKWYKINLQVRSTQGL